MTFPAIRRAIVQVLEGELGAVRTVPPGTMTQGAFEGEAVTAQQAQALTIPRFEVRLTGFQHHASTPVGVIGSHRYDEMSVEIRMHHKITAIASQIEQRNAIRDLVLVNGNLAWMALARPRNLLQTLDAPPQPTGIVSGCLIGPHQFAIVDERWTEKMIEAHLTARAVVKIGQVTA